MERSIEQELLIWKNSLNRKPLIIRGARQVGKSYSVTQFGERHFDNGVVPVDFELHPWAVQIFEKDLDPVRIISEIEQSLGVRIYPGKTVLFLDEIQKAPKAIMALRYFYEKIPDMHVIAAGSLLEFALEKGISFPVGRVQFFEMQPMNFYEFVIALGYDKLACKLLEFPRKLSDTIHQKLRELLRMYFFVGGMPEAVKTYTDTKSFVETRQIQQSLIQTYIEDFSKYAPLADKTCMYQIFSSVARNIGSQIIYSHLAKNYSNKTISKDFYLLCKAQIIQSVLCTRSYKNPLDIGVNHKKFKALMLDIGLLQNILGVGSEQEGNLLDIFRGSLAEQFVGQELRVTQGRRLYYWAREKRGSSAEVDYLIVENEEAIPIEVKSGPSGKLRSLNLFLAAYPDIKKGYVFYDGEYNYLKEQKLEFLPLYYVYIKTKNLNP